MRSRYINLPELNFTDQKSDLVQKHTLGEKGEMAQAQDEPGSLGLGGMRSVVFEGVRMVRDLPKLQSDIEDKLHNSELSLFKNS